MTKQKPAAPAESAGAEAADTAAHQKVVELIRGRTMEMSFTVHGLPKSRRIGGKLAEQVAGSVKGTRRGVRSSWSMFTSDHPAVKELGAAIRDLEVLRDTWTIVKSADVRTDGDKVTIAGGKRLIWDKDVAEFHALFVQRARLIDKCVEKLQHAMNNVTKDADDKPVKSVKDMDRANAGEAWDESAYPQDLTQTVGVAKDRNPDGSLALDADGNPTYVIKFEEYHVSEKLPEALRERAIQRIDQGLSGTIETAMTYAVGELSDQMLTFFGELSNRVKVYPVVGSEFAYAHGGEVVKTVTQAEDAKLSPGQVRVYVRYKEGEGAETKSVSKWFGPMSENAFATAFRPQATGEKKKIYPTVIEGLITQLEAFKLKKAKMLGSYGDDLVAAFEPLLATLTKAKAANPWASNATAAQKLAAALKGDAGVREAVSKEIADTIEALEGHVVAAKEAHRRRSIKTSLIGMV